MKIFEPKSYNGIPYVIAHRGVSAKAPENTMASFEYAANFVGIDMVELDVRLTKDEEVIVLHDRTLQRTSTGNGPARNYTLQEINNFDAGSWFNPIFKNEKIPTLQQVIQQIGNKIFIDIEIKSDFLHPEPEGLLEEKVYDIITRYGAKNRVMISSFNHKILARLKKIDSTLTTGILYNFAGDLFRMPSSLAKKADASIFICAKHELTPRMLEDVKKNNIAIYVYTLNSIKEAERMINLGVDGIISNNADDIVKVVNNYLNNNNSDAKNI